MIVLTSAQAVDLRYLVALYRLSVGFTKTQLAVGDSVRTGRTLARKGLVEPSARQFSNRVGTWVPTTLGIGYVERNFVLFDRFAVEAVERAIRALEVHA